MPKQQTKLEKLISEGKVVLIEASKLSLDDKFMRYKPKTREEELLYECITEVIKSGVKDFYRPILDPSFTDDFKICYEFGRRPAVDCLIDWWEEKSKDFNKNCRIGTDYEYVAFLGVLIKKLLKSGWTVSKAWNAVCNDSRELGRYFNSENAKHNSENTGSREVCGFYDLANTCKILKAYGESDIYCRASGAYSHGSSFYPLANIRYYKRDEYKNFQCVGWLVFDVDEN